MPKQELIQKYENEIKSLNEKVRNLQKNIQNQQLSSQNYKESLQDSYKQYSSTPLPREVNPILKQIRNKDLSLREKRDIIYPTLYPSPPQDILYQWVAPSRLSAKRDKQWYWTVGLLFLIVVTFSLIFRELIWIAVATAFFFAILIQESITPDQVVYKLTKQGIEIGEGLSTEIFSWGQILDYAYYFKYNTEIIYIDTILSSPQRFTILFNQEDRRNINMILEANIPYKPPPQKQGILSRLSNGIYIPINDFKALQKKIDNFYNEKYAGIINQLKKEGKVSDSTSVDDVKRLEAMKTINIMNELKKHDNLKAREALGI